MPRATNLPSGRKVVELTIKECRKLVITFVFFTANGCGDQGVEISNNRSISSENQDELCGLPDVPEPCETQSTQNSPDDSGLLMTDASDDRPLGIFFAGDYRTELKNWGAKWYVTNYLKWVYLYKGRVYKWKGQSKPDDSAHLLPGIRLTADQSEIDLDLGPDATRATVAATLQAIAKWYGTQPTEPYRLPNYLFNSGHSKTELNEVWLKTMNGPIYFVDGEIYKWEGEEHGKNPLVAKIRLDGFHRLLAYVALNPTAMPDLLSGDKGLLGRQLKGMNLIKQITIHPYSDSKLYKYNIGIKKYGDFLDGIIAEAKASWGFYSVGRDGEDDNVNLGFAELRSESGKLSEATIGRKPYFASAYTGKPVQFPRKSNLETQFGSGVIFNTAHKAEFMTVQRGEFLERLPLSFDSYFLGSGEGISKVEMVIEGRRWLIGLINVSNIKPQIKPGNVFSKINPYFGNSSDSLQLDHHTVVELTTSGWTTPIKSVSVGKTNCVAIQSVERGVQSAPHLSQDIVLSAYRSSYNPNYFKCIIDTMPSAKEERGPIKVRLIDGKQFVLSSTGQTVHHFASEPAKIEGNDSPDTCANICKFYGGVWPMSDSAEENACRAANVASQANNFTADRTSGGFGCIRGGRSRDGLFKANNIIFEGPANRKAAAAKRVCFCRASAGTDRNDFKVEN